MRPFHFLMVAISATAVAACATVEPPVGAGLLSPAEAVHGAAASAPRTTPGPFALRIRAVGSQGGNIYLNSEEDYRDQRNLTVAIRPSAIPEFVERFGEPERLIGKDVVITGEARRVRIDFTHGGRPTGKYYYQTHVDVRDADQLSLR